jgi:hypothetical protein
MSNTKREPLLNDGLIELFNDRKYIECEEKWPHDEAASFHFTDGHLAGMDEVRFIYEAARAKDAELIQDAVDEFHQLLMMRQDELRAFKPAPPPHIMEMLLTQSATAKFYIDFLDRAASAGFKPTEP